MDDGRPDERTVAGGVRRPDGKTLAVIGGGGSGSITCLWDIATRRQTATLTDPRPAGTFAGAQGGAFSPDGKVLAIGDADGSTYLWDVATRRLAATLNDPTVSIDDGERSRHR